jgi:uncharacterized membrane protein YhaH (DUF805 family)
MAMQEEMSPGPETDTRVLNPFLPAPRADKGLLYFSGRIPRSTFWLRWLLGMGLILTCAAILELDGGIFTEIPSALLLVLTLWINLATQVKRWHDMDLPGWFVALNMIPFFGVFVLIWQGCAPGTVGSNRYGIDPLGESLTRLLG